MEQDRMYQEVRVDNDQLHIALSGDVFAPEAKAMQQSLFGYIADGHRMISLDLSGVNFIDGTGLAALVSIHKQIRDKGGHLQIAGLQGEVKELFRLTELDKMLEID
jgi:anti-anti-sigma factor